MKILVTGAEGMLGRAVVAAFRSRHTVVGVDLPDGDLTTPTTAARLLDTHAPEWVVHSAAFTDVDGAEKFREEALRVNRDAVRVLGVPAFVIAHKSERSIREVAANALFKTSLWNLVLVRVDPFMMRKFISPRMYP